MATPETVKNKFEFTCGRLIRKQVEGEMRRLAFFFDLELDLRETKGLLESSFYGAVSGDAGKMDQFYKAWKQYLAQFEEGL